MNGWVSPEWARHLGHRVPIWACPLCRRAHPALTPERPVLPLGSFARATRPGRPLPRLGDLEEVPVVTSDGQTGRAGFGGTHVELPEPRPARPWQPPGHLAAPGSTPVGSVPAQRHPAPRPTPRPDPDERDPDTEDRPEDLDEALDGAPTGPSEVPAPEAIEIPVPVRIGGTLVADPDGIDHAIARAAQAGVVGESIERVRALQALHLAGQTWAAAYAWSQSQGCAPADRGRVDPAVVWAFLDATVPHTTLPSPTVTDPVPEASHPDAPVTQPEPAPEPPVDRVICSCGQPVAAAYVARTGRRHHGVCPPPT